MGGVTVAGFVPPTCQLGLLANAAAHVSEQNQ